VDNGDDCDDGDDEIYPWAIELCDGVDNDCNGAVDDYCYDEDGGYPSDGTGADTEGPYDPASTEVESCEDVAPDPAMCDGESTGDTSDDGHTEAPPESSDPTTSSGGTLSLSCGSEWFDAPDDGAGFWVTLADGSMAEGYTSGGFEHWCSQGASVDAADWGDGLDYWSNGMTYVQGGLTAPYCNGGETTAEDACANAY